MRTRCQKSYPQKKFSVSRLMARVYSRKKNVIHTSERISYCQNDSENLAKNSVSRLVARIYGKTVKTAELPKWQFLYIYSTHTPAYAHTRTHTHTHAHAHTRTHMHTHAHACTHACTHTRTRMHTHACTHAHARMHTHTHARAGLGSVSGILWFLINIKPINTQAPKTARP